MTCNLKNRKIPQSLVLNRIYYLLPKLLLDNYIMLQCDTSSITAVILLQSATLNIGYKVQILNLEILYHHFNAAVVIQIVKDKR